MAATLVHPVTAPASSPTVASPPTVLSRSPAPIVSVLQSRQTFKTWCIGIVDYAIDKNLPNISLIFSIFREHFPQMPLHIRGNAAHSSISVHSVFQEIEDDFWNGISNRPIFFSSLTETRANILIGSSYESYATSTAFRRTIQEDNRVRIELIFQRAQGILNELKRNGQTSGLLYGRNYPIPAYSILAEVSLRLAPLGGKITRILGDWHVTCMPQEATALSREDSTSVTKTPT